MKPANFPGRELARKLGVVAGCPGFLIIASPSQTERAKIDAARLVRSKKRRSA